MSPCISHWLQYSPALKWDSVTYRPFFLFYILLLSFSSLFLCSCPFKGWHQCDVNEPNSARRPDFHLQVDVSYQMKHADNTKTKLSGSVNGTTTPLPQQFFIVSHSNAVISARHMLFLAYQKLFFNCSIICSFAIVDLLHISASARGYVMRLVARGCADTRDCCSALWVNAKKENLGL